MNTCIFKDRWSVGLRVEVVLPLNLSPSLFVRCCTFEKFLKVIKNFVVKHLDYVTISYLKLSERKVISPFQLIVHFSNRVLDHSVPSR